MSRPQELAYWINERERMRLRRGAPFTHDHFKYGWSDDPAMGTVRYCNIRREDDKVTKWLAANWRPYHHEVWEILLARLINNIPMLERLLLELEGDDPLKAVKHELKYWRQHGTIFGSAYTVSTNGHSMDKVDYIIEHVVRPAKEQEIVFDGPLPTLAQACKVLCMLNGVSNFMAGQIIADLKNTEGHPLKEAPDWWTWACPGPGSLRGLEAYFGRRVTPSTFAKDLRLCYAETKPLLESHVGELHMQDFQNCMCEFSKYARFKEGGHARNRYRTGND